MHVDRLGNLGRTDEPAAIVELVPGKLRQAAVAAKAPLPIRSPTGCPRLADALLNQTGGILVGVAVAGTTAGQRGRAEREQQLRELPARKKRRVSHRQTI